MIEKRIYRRIEITRKRGREKKFCQRTRRKGKKEAEINQGEEKRLHTPHWVQACSLIYTPRLGRKEISPSSIGEENRGRREVAQNSQSIKLRPLDW